MFWVYQNKITKEVVNSPCIDSFYWTPNWELIKSPYDNKQNCIADYIPPYAVPGYFKTDLEFKN
jgi:hypothetical protein